MEKIGDKLALRSLTSLSNGTLDEKSLSVYQDNLTMECVKFNCAKILTAFKGLDTNFTNLLAESLKRNGFTDQRLTDAVNYVIDNCPYPSPSIAEFVKFDKSVKVYSYDEMIKLGYGTEPFKKVRLNQEQEKPLWVFESDYEKYGLKKFEW